MFGKKAKPLSQKMSQNTQLTELFQGDGEQAEEVRSKVCPAFSLEKVQEDESDPTFDLLADLLVAKSATEQEPEG